MSFPLPSATQERVPAFSAAGRTVPLSSRAGSDSKRWLVVRGARIRVTVEAAYWPHLERIAAERRQSLADLVAAIEATSHGVSLKTALRLAVLADLERRCGLSPALRSAA